MFTSVRDNKFSVFTSVNACAKWVVEDFHVGESKSFKAMIKALNPKLIPPDAKTLKRKLHLMKASASANMKIFLNRKYLSVTIDHGTFIANQNYAALTLHIIENFVLKSLTLSCLKHEGDQWLVRWITSYLMIWTYGDLLQTSDQVRKTSGGEIS